MTRSLRRFRDERGQALVIMVVVVAAAAFLVEVVTDGGWLLRAQRHTQAIADAAALAAAQEFPSGNPRAVARDYANRNLAGARADVEVESDSREATVTVTVSRDVDGLFGLLVGEFEVTASARAGAPTTLDNEDLRAVLGAPSYVVPLVLRSDVCGGVPWRSSCFGRRLSLDLRFRGGGGGGDDDEDEGGEEIWSESEFGIVDLACATSSGCSGADSGDVAAWLGCSPCLAGELGIGRDFAAVDADDVVRDALDGIRGRTVIVPVFSSIEGETFQGIEGFAAFVVTRVRNWNDTRKRIEGRVLTYTASDSTRIDPDSSNLNFGVRAFGLIY